MFENVLSEGRIEIIEARIGSKTRPAMEEAAAIIESRQRKKERRKAMFRRAIRSIGMLWRTGLPIHR